MDLGQPLFVSYSAALHLHTTHDGVTQVQASRLLKKMLGMLRDPQHERKIINDFKSSPFILSYVEGLREDFSAAR